MPAKRTNILFLMTDQLRYDQIGITNPVLKTPNLDALAAEAVHFTRAYTPNPVCVPARAALATGRYPSQTGVPYNAHRLPAHERTVTAMLRDAGYHTAVVGKQHFNGSEIARGYRYEDIVDSHHPAQVIEPEALAGTQHDNSYQHFLYEHGFRRGSELFELVDDPINRWKVDVRFHVDHYIGQRGLDWLATKRPDDVPWFLCISFPGPHGPIDGHGLPQEARYNLDEIDLPATSLEDLEAKPKHYARHAKANRDKPYPEDLIRRLRRAWYANVSLIDDQVGQILQALRDSGDYDNTLIVFSTDHGDFTCDFNQVDKGPFLLEPLMHIPLLIKPPVADFAGRTEDALVSSIDLPATWLTAAGVPVPANMRSQDLSPYWTGAAHTDRSSVYMEANHHRGIRTDRWKFVHYLNDEDGELYDLENDPWETQNLWHAPELQPLKVELTRELLDHVIALGENGHLTWNQPPLRKADT